MGNMQILNSSGHTTVAWDTQVEEEVTVARDEFERLLRGGHRAYSDGGAVKEFDPQIEEMVVICPMAGG